MGRLPRYSLLRHLHTAPSPAAPNAKYHGIRCSPGEGGAPPIEEDGCAMAADGAFFQQSSWQEERNEMEGGSATVCKRHLRGNRGASEVCTAEDIALASWIAAACPAALQPAARSSQPSKARHQGFVMESRAPIRPTLCTTSPLPTSSTCIDSTNAPNGALAGTVLCRTASSLHG